MTDNQSKPLSPDTLVLHADDNDTDSSVAPPIYQTATFWAADAERFEEMESHPREHPFYTRYGNPTVARAAEVVRALEGAEDATVFPSGMAAISAVYFTLLRSGDHVICQEHIYAGAIAQLQELRRAFGIEITFVDQRDPRNFERALKKNTRLMILDTPSHPLMRLTDLRAVANLAREHGVFTMVDNTTATPINQHPLKFGADLVAHSATKALAGHSDIQSGAVAGSHELVERIHRRNILMGATTSPHDAWLLLRGLRTLALRVQRQNENGMRVASALENDARIERVHYPGLASHPQHELAQRQMDGYAGVLGIEVRGGFAAADAFIGALKRVRRAASIGAVQSLIVHPAAMWKGLLTPEQLAERGIGGGLVRLSVGIDAAQDILDDVSQALDAIPLAAKA
jgi:methionine-gamma-lyase